MKFLRYTLAILGTMIIYAHSTATAQPRLVVNIVVSSMRADDLTKYENNFSQGGFRRLINEGAYFTNASYDYMQTSTPVSLATLST